MRRFVLISNISKRNNIEALLRCAAAFDFTPILIDKRCSIDPSINNSESYMRVSISVPFGAGDGTPRAEVAALKFRCLDDCSAYLRAAQVPIVGLEIVRDAASSLALPTELVRRGRVCLVPGNEGTGLVGRLRALCDCFVFVPQYGSGTASLNVHIATTLALHQFCHQHRLITTSDSH